MVMIRPTCLAWPICCWLRAEEWIVYLWVIFVPNPLVVPAPDFSHVLTLSPKNVFLSRG